jgi:hypothetical protein
MEGRYSVDVCYRIDGNRAEQLIQGVVGWPAVSVVVWIGVLYEALVDWTQGTRVVSQ